MVNPIFRRELYGNRNYFILHDNAAINTSKVVSGFLAENLTLRMIEHQQYSPDLNVIENFDAQFKKVFTK